MSLIADAEQPNDSSSAVPVVVVMGVSAVGKSSVASQIAAQLDLPFVDADDLHPPANIAKMAQGTPLDDIDRGPWLDEVARTLAVGGAGSGIVVACSALRRRYRDRLRGGAPQAVFIHLSGSDELLGRRAAARTDHFMPPSLLRSQLDALEPLGSDEPGIVLDVAPPVAQIAMAALEWVRSDER